MKKHLYTLTGLALSISSNALAALNLERSAEYGKSIGLTGVTR